MNQDVGAVGGLCREETRGGGTHRCEVWMKKSCNSIKLSAEMDWSCDLMFLFFITINRD